MPENVNAQTCSIQRIAAKKFKNNKLKKKGGLIPFLEVWRNFIIAGKHHRQDISQKDKGASNALRPLVGITVRIRHCERFLNKQARNDFSHSFSITVPAPNLVDRQARVKCSKWPSGIAPCWVFLAKDSSKRGTSRGHRVLCNSKTLRVRLS